MVMQKNTDKAANPVSMMGASKRVMEDIVFSDPDLFSTSARFANVAFSNGSLLQSWHIRMIKRQPLAVPKNTRRYFVSLQEAAEICVIAGCYASSRNIVYPGLDPKINLVDLQSIAEKFVLAHGYIPLLTEDENFARICFEDSISKRKYPILLTTLDTSGEKEFEEFFIHSERQVDLGLDFLRAIEHQMPKYNLDKVISEIEVGINQPELRISKNELINTFKIILQSFNHRETGFSLDQRM